MSNLAQWIIVAGVVAGAVVFLVRRLGRGACECDCPYASSCNCKCDKQEK